MNRTNNRELNVFSFFVAVASIIATLVYQLINKEERELAREYALVAVYALFMAMSFALSYYYGDDSSKDNKLDSDLRIIAGAFLDGFLVTSLFVVVVEFLRQSFSNTVFTCALSFVIVLWFGCVLLSLYGKLDKSTISHYLSREYLLRICFIIFVALALIYYCNYPLIGTFLLAFFMKLTIDGYWEFKQTDIKDSRDKPNKDELESQK
ncbi:hypothetical protein [Thermococcus barophilus]|uniref:Uncharacterized protein n=1 Tax=Thermococcus barophilus (strain DSM 11836 / MP) TaxID=391623 RepID=F0LKJ7_THEBM|nr:hypothetical protein [Thermococcus barophilus]ADT84831.1 hypothetical protein TERMP_01856 [Thermococcus barophilus MP]